MRWSLRSKDRVSADSVYLAVAERRTQLDSLMWQVPAFALAAQGVLLAVAYSPNTGYWPRVVAAAVATLVGFLALQLFLRHRHHEFVTGDWLGDQEELAGHPRVHGEAWGDRVNKKKPRGFVFGWLAGKKSARIWGRGLLTILLVDAASFVVAVAWPSVFADETGTASNAPTPTVTVTIQMVPPTPLPAQPPARSPAPIPPTDGPSSAPASP